MSTNGCSCILTIWQEDVSISCVTRCSTVSPIHFYREILHIVLLYAHRGRLKTMKAYIEMPCMERIERMHSPIFHSNFTFFKFCSFGFLKSYLFNRFIEVLGGCMRNPYRRDSVNKMNTLFYCCFQGKSVLVKACIHCII